MHFKVTVCLIIFAIVPFSNQTKGETGVTSNLAEWKKQLKENRDKCGTKSKKDVEKLSKDILKADDKAKLQKELDELIKCLGNIAKFTELIAADKEHKKQVAEAEAQRKKFAAYAERAKKMKMEPEYRVIEKKLSDAKTALESMKKREENVYREYLNFLLQMRQKECGNKKEENVRKLAFQQAQKPEEKEKLEKQWMELIVCLEDIQTLQGMLAKYGDFF